MDFIDLDVRFKANSTKVSELGFSDFRSPFAFEMARPGDARKIPPSTQLAAASSLSIELLREAAKSKRVSLLCNRGFITDVGLIRDSAAQKKPFEIPIAPLLECGGIPRAILMSKMRFFIKICTKLRAPLVIVSQAKDEFQLKSPEEMIAIGEMLGLSHDQAEWAITEIPEMVLDASR